MTRLVPALTAALVLTLTSTLAWAQATGSISGTARDQSGAVLPGVTVTVTHTGTGGTRTTVSNESGAYALPNLPLGPYRLEATLARLQRVRPDRHRPAGEQQSGGEPGHGCRSGVRADSSHGGGGAGRHTHRRCGDRGRIAANRRAAAQRAAGHAAHHTVRRGRADCRVAGLRHEHRRPDLGGRQQRLRRDLHAGRRPQQQRARRHRLAAAVSRRAPGVPPHDRRPGGLQRAALGRGGERGHPLRHQRAPRLVVRVQPEQPLQRAGLLHQSEGRSEAEPVRRHGGRTDQAGQGVLLRRLSGHHHATVPPQRHGVRAHRGDDGGRLHRLYVSRLQRRTRRGAAARPVRQQSDRALAHQSGGAEHLTPAPDPARRVRPGLHRRAQQRERGADSGPARFPGQPAALVLRPLHADHRQPRHPPGARAGRRPHDRFAGAGGGGLGHRRRRPLLHVRPHLRDQLGDGELVPSRGQPHHDRQAGPGVLRPAGRRHQRLHLRAGLHHRAGAQRLQRRRRPVHHQRHRRQPQLRPQRRLHRRPRQPPDRLRRLLPSRRGQHGLQLVGGRLAGVHRPVHRCRDGRLLRRAHRRLPAGEPQSAERRAELCRRLRAGQLENQRRHAEFRCEVEPVHRDVLPGR